MHTSHSFTVGQLVRVVHSLASVGLPPAFARLAVVRRVSAAHVWVTGNGTNLEQRFTIGNACTYFVLPAL